MTLAARVTYLAACLVGLCVGMLTGYKTTKEMLDGYEEAKYLTAPGLLSDFAQMQYKHADLEHAGAALLSYSSLLEEMEKLKPEKEREVELSAAYTRLALLQDETGNEQQSHSYMVKAGSWYRRSGAPDLPEVEMKARLKAYDQRMEAAGIR